MRVQRFIIGCTWTLKSISSPRILVTLKNQHTIFSHRDASEREKRNASVHCATHMPQHLINGPLYRARSDGSPIYETFSHRCSTDACIVQSYSYRLSVEWGYIFRRDIIPRFGLRHRRRHIWVHKSSCNNSNNRWLHSFTRHSPQITRTIDVFRVFKYGQPTASASTSEVLFVYFKRVEVDCYLAACQMVFGERNQ